jgi:hypothetical protein
MPVAKITRRHVLHFREALQDLPIRRSGKLRSATLPELVEWSKHHSRAPRVSNATVNKLLGGVQAVALWARDNGLIADDSPWADPFANMRLPEDSPTREPWQLEELRLLFASAVFTRALDQLRDAARLHSGCHCSGCSQVPVSANSLPSLQPM